MSSTIRNSGLALLAAALLVAGCRGEQSADAERTAARGDVAEASDSAAEGPARIDPEPAPGSSQVLAREDIRVDGEPACALNVRFAGLQDQPVTWAGEPCAALTARFLTLADLEALGQAGKLDPEARGDLARLAERRGFYVEGRFASALYLPNSAGFVREVPLAD